jgi:hypothetical protein
MSRRRSAFLNVWLVLGLALGLGPLALALFLDATGLVNLGNGLGLGLVYTFILVPAVLLTLAGFYIGLARVIR